MPVEITVNDPINPLNIPIYEGPAEHAVHQLIPGVYDATGVVDGVEDIPGQLVIHGGQSVFEVDQCGMLGCPHGSPHNHPEWALMGDEPHDA